jgi:hypothetical protein
LRSSDRDKQTIDSIELKAMNSLKKYQIKNSIAAVAFALAGSYASIQMAQARPPIGAIAPQPEFTRGGGGCSQFGRIDPGRITPAGNETVSRVLQELIMRRCVMEGVPVTGAEEDRLYPLIKALTAGVRANLGNNVRLKAQYDTFLIGARQILDTKRLSRVEAHVTAVLVPNIVSQSSDRSQMIQENRRAGGSEIMQPEFQRGSGCMVVGTTDAGRVSRDVELAVSRVVLQSVFRRCLLENVPLTAAEDERLFPSLNALTTGVEGLNPQRYRQFAAAARQILDPVRAMRVRANVALAIRGLR